MYSETTATRKITRLTKRIRAIQGGTSASKTVSILLYLIARAQLDTTATVTSVVSESLPHLKRGAIRDFLDILKTHSYFKEDRWSQTEFIYTFETGSIIEFFGADQPDKVKGPRRERLFINECNNISFEVFEQLEVRTNEFVLLDWNPTNEFWFYDELMGKRDDVEHIVLTYRDNEALNPAIRDSIELRRNRKGWWRVYGEGQLGEVEGKIFTDWRLDIDAIAHEAQLERYWLDFGYSNDPTAIGALYRLNGGYILDEITYQKGLSNKQIADILLNQPQALIVADSAEPKSIDEIASYGLTIVPARKGKDSITSGIQLVQQQRISVTKRSVNLIKEYRNYLWEVDRDGKILNVPIPIYNHHMDGIRYVFSSLLDFLPENTLNRQAEQFSRTTFRQNLNSAK